MLNEFFIKQGIKETRIEQFIRNAFPMGDYSRMELQRTPLGVKVVIYTSSPGRIIGKGGRTINEITQALKTEFELENPQVDVKAVRNPYLDAKIVAKQIISFLQRGYNFKKIGNLVMKKVMGAGAIGVEIAVSGKAGGSKAMTAKFTDGYLKHCGHPAKILVDEGFETAATKPGIIGVRVKIMREFMDITGEIRTTREKIKPEEKQEEKKEEQSKKRESKSKPGKKETKTQEKKEQKESEEKAESKKEETPPVKESKPEPSDTTKKA